jgi:hypothetical protein
LTPATFSGVVEVMTIELITAATGALFAFCLLILVLGDGTVGGASCAAEPDWLRA